MSKKRQYSDFENFKAYYTGKMSPEERSAFEENLANDPFAQDAYDGFLSLESDTKRVSFMESANMAFQDKHHLNRDVVVFPLKTLLGIAASIALFVGVFYIVQDQFFSDNTFAENNIKETESEEVVKYETTEVIEPETIIISDSVQDFSEPESELEAESEPELEKEKTIAIPKEIKTVKKEKQVDVMPKPKTSPKPTSTADGFVTQNQNTLKDRSVVKSGEETIKQEQSATYNSIPAPTVVEETEDNTAGLMSDYQSGIVSYNQSKFDNAIKFFNNSINSKINVNSSNYYIAMSYFNLGKSNKAITYFDKVIGTDSSFSDDAQYFKAVTLIGKGQTENAKIILKELINSNSSFKTSAQNKLNSL